MKLLGLIDRIDEMAFKRRAIIDKLRALQPSINEYALKIIAYPDAEEIPHWKRELIARGNDPAAVPLRGFRGVTPMGFAPAWNDPYREPFEGAEDRVLAFKLGRIEREYQRPITTDRGQILTRLTDFLRSYCEAIGKASLLTRLSTRSDSLSVWLKPPLNNVRGCRRLRATGYNECPI